jgi:hypothetical protein
MPTSHELLFASDVLYFFFAMWEFDGNFKEQNLKMAVFWVVALVDWYKFTNILEFLTY